jgi:hypothetical protein
MEPVEVMTFGEALKVLRRGGKVARCGWNGVQAGKSMWLKLQKPTSDSKMTLPYIYLKTADGNRVPWLASQTDLLSDDWVIVE